jgi:hypothetical protein
MKGARECLKKNKVAVSQTRPSGPLTPALKRLHLAKSRWDQRPPLEKSSSAGKVGTEKKRTSKGSLSQPAHKFKKLSEEEAPDYPQSSRRLRSEAAADRMAAQELDSMLSPTTTRKDYEGASWWPPDQSSSFLRSNNRPSADLVEKIRSLSGLSSAVVHVAAEMPSLDEPGLVLTCSNAPLQGSSPSRYLDASADLMEEALPRRLPPTRDPSVSLSAQSDIGEAPTNVGMGSPVAKSSPQ